MSAPTPQEQIDSVFAERASGLRSGDWPERVGTPAIEPANADDLQPGDAGPERLDQSGRGCVVRLEPLPRHRRHRRRNRLTVVQHPRRSSVLPGHSFRSTSGRRRGTGRSNRKATRLIAPDVCAPPGSRAHESRLRSREITPAFRSLRRPSRQVQLEAHLCTVGFVTRAEAGLSAPSRCFDGGDVDLLHRHHRLEGTLCLAATSRKRLG